MSLSSSKIVTLTKKKLHLIVTTDIFMFKIECACIAIIGQFATNKGCACKKFDSSLGRTGSTLIGYLGDILTISACVLAFVCMFKVIRARKFLVFIRIDRLVRCVDLFILQKMLEKISS